MPMAHKPVDIHHPRAWYPERVPGKTYRPARPSHAGAKQHQIDSIWGRKMAGKRLTITADATKLRRVRDPIALTGSSIREQGSGKP